MDLSQSLQPYIGRTVEVIQATQATTGVLTASGDGAFTVLTTAATHTDGGSSVTFFTNQIEHVLVLPA